MTTGPETSALPIPPDGPNGTLPMRVMVVSTLDVAGGAEKVARDVVAGLKAHGHKPWLAVGYKRTGNPEVLAIPRDRHYHPHNPAALPPLTIPKIVQEIEAGLEDFNFPGTWDLLDLPPERPDLVHCHNLHGGYFDLRVLPWLSRQVPTVLTLHDAWSLAGHCAHSFDCDRWSTGCGECPDLSIYPPLHADGTAHNWKRKQDIYRRSRLYVSAPSRWMLDRALAGILREAIVESRVIPNGVDVNFFRPRSKEEARRELGIPQDFRILLFAANGIRNNPWKDYRGMRAVLERLATRLPGGKLALIGLGEAGPPEWIGDAQIVLVPYQTDPVRMAAFYQAADLYLHLARAESFGLVIAEAMCCGTPVAANAVGGIPELVSSLLPVRGVNLPVHGEDTATGLLAGTGAGMAEDVVEGIARLLENPGLLRRLGANAARDAQARFDVTNTAAQYVDWFQSIVKRQRRWTEPRRTE